MFKSQGQGVNPRVWAVTLPCSEATTVGRQSLDTVALPWAGFPGQESGSSTLLSHFSASRDLSWCSWEFPTLLVALGIWDLTQAVPVWHRGSCCKEGPAGIWICVTLFSHSKYPQNE